MEKKKLYKSKADKKICGVCGGIAEYLDCDPTMVRLVAVLIALAAGSGLLAYFIAAIVMEFPPEDPYTTM